MESYINVNNFNLSKYTFTKSHTQIAKGIAVLLMLYHHLFVIPERLNNEYISILDLIADGTQIYLACFAKICVCIFVFLSGYGLYFTLHKSDNIFGMYKIAFKHAIKFLLNFWIVVLIAIPLGFIIGRYDFSIKGLILSLLGSSNYCGEWWFVSLYLVLIIVAPIIVNALKSKIGFISRMLPIVILFSFYIMIRIIIKYYNIEANNLFFSYFWQLENFPALLTFGVGIVSAKLNIYNAIMKFIENKINVTLFAVLISILSVIIRVLACKNSPTSMKIDFIVVPMFVFSFATLIEKSRFASIFEYFGKHSANMWLIHTFWCYYYFQKIVLIPRYSILIFLWLIVLSLVSSYIINLLYIPFLNKIFGKEHKFNYKNYFYYIKEKDK